MSMHLFANGNGEETLKIRLVPLGIEYFYTNIRLRFCAQDIMVLVLTIQIHTWAHITTI